jgi:hypothetical protein
MKRFILLSILGVSTLSLASCGKPQPPPEVHHHYYSRTTRYVSTPTRSSNSASVPTYKPAGVTNSNSPEGFEAVTPPASYSR